jgi:AcrR family transcriptional regulator
MTTAQSLGRRLLTEVAGPLVGEDERVERGMTQAPNLLCTLRCGIRWTAMPRKTGANAQPRAPLSKERVLRAAITLADEGGIEALSMRRLAQELGVEAMSLYNHVANKDDILAGIVDLVVEEMEAPSKDADWKVAMRQSAISAHEALLRHRWACSLMMSSTGVRAARLRHSEAILATLREAGFSPDLTHHAYHALESHIIGFTLWQVSLPFETEDLAQIGAAFLRELPADEYPYFFEHVMQHLEPSDEDQSAFEFGLDLILDGLERLRDSA